MISWWAVRKKYVEHERRLLSQLRSLHAEILSKAERSCQPPSKEESEEIDRLEGLISATRRLTPQFDLERKITFAIVLLAGLVAIYLVISPVGSADMEAELLASECAFMLDSETQLVDLGKTKECVLFDLLRLECGNEVLYQGARGAGSPASLIARGSARESGVNVSALTLPAGTAVSISKFDNRLRIAIRVPGKESVIRIEATVVGGLTFHVADEDHPIHLEREYKTPEHVLCSSSSREMTIEIALDPEHPLQFKPQVQVHQISFMQGGTEVPGRDLSSILGGSLELTELGSPKRELRPFEEVVIEGHDWANHRGLRLRSIVVEKTGLRINLYGEVTTLSCGTAAFRTNLLPSRLEWLYAQRRVQLFWSASAFLVGLILVVLRWAKGSPVTEK